MKLLYLIPGVMGKSRMGTAELERRRGILQSMAAAGVQVEVRDTPSGPQSIESLCEEYEAVPETVRAAVQAERDGFDAIILGCYADPGIDAIREMVRIPVVGPFESSVTRALTLGYRFGILTVTSSMTGMLEEKVAALGIASRKLACVRAVDMNVLELLDDKTLLMNRLSEQAERMVRDDRADSLILGCITLAFSGTDRALSEQFGIPVVNPILTALNDAQGMVAMGLCHSKKAFPLPPKLCSGC